MVAYQLTWNAESAYFSKAEIWFNRRATVLYSADLLIYEIRVDFNESFVEWIRLCHYSLKWKAYIFPLFTAKRNPAIFFWAINRFVGHVSTQTTLSVLLLQSNNLCWFLTFWLLKKYHCSHFSLSAIRDRRNLNWLLNTVTNCKQ